MRRGDSTTRAFRARAARLAALSATVLMALAIPLPAWAGYVVNHTIQNPADVKPNPCSPADFVSFQSTLHTVVRVNEDARGGYHVGLQSNWVASGRSLATGVEYRGSQTSEKSTYVGTRETVTWVDSVHLIGEATTEDFLMHATYHVTVGPGGVPTVLVDRLVYECKG